MYLEWVSAKRGTEVQGDGHRVCRAEQGAGSMSDWGGIDANAEVKVIVGGGKMRYADALSVLFDCQFLGQFLIFAELQIQQGHRYGY